MKNADLVISDRSSILHEFASLGKPVLILNTPWYEMDAAKLTPIFASCLTIGVQVSDPKKLPAAIARALRDSPTQRKARDAAVKIAIPYTDGHSAERAVAAIQGTPAPEWQGRPSGTVHEIHKRAVARHNRLIEIAKAQKVVLDERRRARDARTAKVLENGLTDLD
jgi:hypothetical protein